MPSVFETSIIASRESVQGRFRPAFSDKTFWSDVIISTQRRGVPSESFTLIASDGSRFVDDAANPLVAVQVQALNLGHFLTDGGDTLVDSSGNTLYVYEQVA